MVATVFQQPRFPQLQSSPPARTVMCAPLRPPCGAITCPSCSSPTPRVSPVDTEAKALRPAPRPNQRSPSTCSRAWWSANTGTPSASVSSAAIGQPRNPGRSCTSRITPLPSSTRPTLAIPTPRTAAPSKQRRAVPTTTEVSSRVLAVRGEPNTADRSRTTRPVPSTSAARTPPGISSIAPSTGAVPGRPVSPGGVAGAAGSAARCRARGATT
ncbi:hypothetical protein AFB00_17765 [Pseudonocardia sp. HH130630-07]|nr:hypothetical protein AFB00_17765 [Pseudonocardia sp. HH130630-07]